MHEFVVAIDKAFSPFAAHLMLYTIELGNRDRFEARALLTFIEGNKCSNLSHRIVDLLIVETDVIAFT